MNPNSSRMYPPAPNYEEEPPAYGNYGETSSFLADHHDSSPLHTGPTMRLLPTSTGISDDLSADVSSNVGYQYGDNYSDDGR